jgi:antibiotic biosynthesis monooxygenase (ABM) superfamily enzyme
MNPPVARVGDAFHLLRHPFSLLFGKLIFVFLHAFIVPLVQRLYRTTVNQSRHKALSV